MQPHPDPSAEYRNTLDYLFSRLPMFSRIGAAALKPDLTNTLKLCAALGNPQDRFKCVHIAGTNGKGSTSHMLASIFAEAGYKTGLYTSPHLVDFRERIRINGRPVGMEFVIRFVEEHRDLIEQVQPSFFEITVAMAFLAFAEEGVDIAIIETGLGGRLDSTNVITPELSIITNISLDHTDLLGNTTPAIAAEKAGIIKPGIPVLIGQYDPETLPVFEETATRLNAPLHMAWRGFGQIIDSGTAHDNPRWKITFRYPEGGGESAYFTELYGDYQKFNIRTVLAAVRILQDRGWAIGPDGISNGLRFVKERTGLRGRMDVLQKRPAIIADVAHNPAGLKLVLDQWNLLSIPRKHIILGFVRDKDVRAALELFPKDNSYHFCAAHSLRALPAAELAALAAEAGLRGTVYPSVKEAVEQTGKIIRNDAPRLITGSFYVVGEAMEALGILP